MEEGYLNDRNAPDIALSGKMGMVMKTESGEGATNRKKPGFRLSEDMHKAKAMLEERGVVFPPPTPQEVREALKQGQ